jgi:uncharacterized protein (DUF58 family)
LLVVSAATLITGYVLPRQELMFAGYFGVFLPLLALLFVRLAKMRLSVTRSFAPPVVAVGHPTVATLDIANTSRIWTTAARWRDQLPWHPYLTPHRALPALPPRTSQFSRTEGIRVRYALTPPRRGIYHSGPMLVELSDPFGLARWEIALGDKQLLIVTPEPVELPDHDLASSAADGSARVMQLRPLGGEDDLMTRNYRAGDALRRVHWRASAHHGELMVRQEEQRTHAEARILVDTQRSGYGDFSAIPWWDESRRDDPESAMFEQAVRLTASLGLHLRREGFVVQVLETASPQIAPVENADEFLTSLASISLMTAQPTRAQFAAFADSSGSRRSQGAVFAIVADVSTDVVDRLIAQRPAFDQAIVFLLSPRSTAARERLEKTGWMCVPVAPGDPVVQLWRSLEYDARTAELRAVKVDQADAATTMPGG